MNYFLLNSNNTGLYYQILEYKNKAIKLVSKY